MIKSSFSTIQREIYSYCCRRRCRTCGGGGGRHLRCCRCRCHRTCSDDGGRRRDLEKDPCSFRSSVSES